MLQSISIRDVVLIDRLDLEFGDRLGVLTGETGAGKSILLDALGLALGQRAEARLVRQGASQASVTAEFSIEKDHPIHQILIEQGLEGEAGQLILRRVLGVDGRSRAFINDQPVGVSLLKQLGEDLVEIHGQFESQRLLNPSAHQGLLDAYGGHEEDVQKTRVAFKAYKEAVQNREKAESDMESAKLDEDFIRHAVTELEAIDPQPGEEDSLAEQRAIMMHSEKIGEGLRDAAAQLDGNRGGVEALQKSIRHLERVAEKAEGKLEPVIETLTRAIDEASDGLAMLGRVAVEMEFEPGKLEIAEERLFSLRALARKHGVSVEQLPALHQDFVNKLAAVEDGSSAILELRRLEEEARSVYESVAAALSQKRLQTAGRLDKAVTGELAALRLGKAVFMTLVEQLPTEAWGVDGADRVCFQVATNPGTLPGPINKIASGGEMSRFMLALKAVLAGADSIPTLVFDEVDAGIGGAVAAAVGDRLNKLASQFQVLVVTHSPQVAARGSSHWRVSKREQAGHTVTSVETLDNSERREEIARMLAGSQVTDEARAAADSLMMGQAS